MVTAYDFERQRSAAQRFAKRCEALALMGLRPVVISKQRDPEHWRAWRNYYRHQGLLASLDLMDDGRSTKTVPTRSPVEFDAGGHVGLVHNWER